MRKMEKPDCSWCVASFLTYFPAHSTQPASTAHCNIAFGELIINFPDNYISESIETVISVLIDMLGSVPHIDFDQSLSWQGRNNHTKSM